MNATQTKQAIEVARRALAMLNPDWQVTGELRAMLQEAMAPVAKAVSKRQKRFQPYKPIDAGHHRTIWKLDMSKSANQFLGDYDIPLMTIEADPKCRCAGCTILRGFHARGMAKVTMMKRNAETDKRVDIEALDVCACGHASKAHAKDELENLLKCEAQIDAINQPCACDHFHYEAKAA